MAINDEECLAQFRAGIVQHNTDHPEAKQCIVYNCQNRIETGSWDNQVLCEEHNLMFLHWFYECDGAKYCPEVFSYPLGERLRKPRGSDKDMNAYRKRYCDWIASLSSEEYRSILLNQIR